MEIKVDSFQPKFSLDENSGNRLPSATERVIQQISAMINEGKIRPGDRFPAERTLAQQNNASRATVREALHYFETLGLVKKIVGSGSYLVDNPDTLYNVIGARQLLERYNWVEMIETRRVLELGIVRLAAERVTREDKLILRRLCDATHTASVNLQNNGLRRAYTIADYQLHHEFARIARNSMLLEMFEIAKDTFIGAETVWQLSTGNIENAQDSHQKIVDAICNGDSNLAVKEMQEHLDFMAKMVGEAMKSGQN